MNRIARSMAILRWALVVGSGAVATYSIATYGFGEQHAETGAPRFYCPMHPQIRSHDPGTCPICHMDLVPIPATRRAPSPEPSHERHAPDGMADVTLTLERRQTYGIESVVVEARDVASELRFPATVEAPPGAIAQVRVRVPAFVERLAVDRIGVTVRRGQTLAVLFSPDVARLGDELAVARALGGAEGVVDGARVGLVRAGVDPESIAAASPDRRGRFSIGSPRAGIVTRVDTTVGSYATPDATLFEITDLARLFVVASLPDVERGRFSEAEPARFEQASGETFDLTLDVVEPTIDPATRTTRARFRLAPGASGLLPGAIGTLVARPGMTRVLAVPRDAVIDTGTLRYVFVDRGEGRFEPRIVEVGARDGDHVAILRGLAAGDRVVARGGFLLDSESRLESAASAPHDHGTPADAGSRGTP